MKIIDLETHFFTNDYIEYIRNRKEPPRETVNKDNLFMWYNNELYSPRTFEIDNRMLDMGEGRLKDMDKHGVAIHVLSLSPPGVQAFDADDGVAWARRLNGELAEVVKQHTDRYAGMACIAPQKPESAADEIDRAVNKLGMKAVSIDSHTRNEYLDHRKYWPIFEMAEKLDVPVCLHPDIPSSGMLQPYADYGFAMAGPALGYAAEVALHTMRLIYSGLFDHCPKLKMVLGHLGEGLPYWMDRIDYFWLKAWQGGSPKIQRKPSDVIRENFTVTISGMFYPPAFMCSYMALGADHIAFGTDYPYEKNEQAIKFMENLNIPAEDKEKIYHLNAEKVFKM
ncbi:amidohydrolase family protein [Chloroflexota bacterium]